MKRYVNIVMGLLLISSIATAKVDNISFHIYGLYSQPNGDFAAKLTDNTEKTRKAGFWIGDNIGLASSGFGLGAELVNPILTPGLNWVFSTRVISNSVDASESTAIFESQLADTSVSDFSYGTWLNIPVLTGFRYDYLISPKLLVYGTLQAGMNFSSMPDKKVIVDGVIAEEKKMDMARDFGMEAGFGFLFNQTYNLSIRYVSLASPRYDGTLTLSEKIFPFIYSRETEILGEQRSISMITITLGIQLFN